MQPLNETQLKSLLECISAGVIVYHLEDPADDRSLRILYANAAASVLTGFDVNARAGQLIQEAFPAVAPERVKVYARAARDGVRTDLGSITYRDARIAESTFSISAVPLPGRCVAGIFENLTQLQKVRDEALRANRHLDSIIENLPAMVFVKEAKDLRFARFNRAGEELLGLSRDALLGKNDYDFFPKEQADFFVAKDREVLASGTVKDIPEEPIDTPRGKRWLHTRKIPLYDQKGEPQFLLGISIDITEQRAHREQQQTRQQELERHVGLRSAELTQEVSERRKIQRTLETTEEQLRQAQKLEAVGRLAGGVAHDFNNLLSVIVGYGDLMMKEMHELDPLRANLEEIRRAGARATDLTRQLLAFSRQQVMAARVLDLNLSVQNMQKMIERLVGEDIEVTFKPHHGLHRVKADPTQIEQVIMNLVVNARDAMPDGGKLTIETANIDLTDTYAAAHPGTRPGPHVMLAVSDSGFGMDGETMKKIFEPFFTTKEKGKGTGLGLSTVFGIVKQSGGSIFVYSEPGKGATFKVYLPITDDPVPTPPRPNIGESLRGTETILLVEDETPVRTMLVQVLKHYGYTVLDSGQPLEVAPLVASHPGPIHLLITDVIMPGLGGRQLADEVRRVKPELPVLFISGYTDDAVVRHGVLESGVAFLQKPISPPALAKRVREILDRPKNP